MEAGEKEHFRVLGTPLQESVIALLYAPDCGLAVTLKVPDCPLGIVMVSGDAVKVKFDPPDVPPLPPLLEKHDELYETAPVI
jgi:hypothetical protein